MSEYDSKIYKDELSYRIEMEAEVGHPKCLGAIYRIRPQLTNEIFYNLPYGNLGQMEEFLEISGASTNFILKYMASSETHETISSEVLKFLINKNTTTLPYGVAEIYFDIHPNRKDREFFLEKTGKYYRGSNLVELIESLNRDADFIGILLKTGNEDTTLILSNIAIREEYPKIILMSIPYVTPETLAANFTQAHHTYQNTDENEVKKAILKMYKTSDLLDNLEEPSDYSLDMY